MLECTLYFMLIIGLHCIDCIFCVNNWRSSSISANGTRYTIIKQWVIIIQWLFFLSQICYFYTGLYFSKDNPERNKKKSIALKFKLKIKIKEVIYDNQNKAVLQ